MFGKTVSSDWIWLFLDIFVSQETEGLIIELRKELRVSDDEHRELLSQVNGDDLIRRIREWREAGGIHEHGRQEDWEIQAEKGHEDENGVVRELEQGEAAVSEDDNEGGKRMEETRERNAMVSKWRGTGWKRMEAAAEMDGAKLHPF
ncbi:hypothetical protein SASPL_141365 [Salvia splendens]|uniref:ENT domain-containing protein n=1 Tax=Salvia splendens TaxID=180675 RepID=A0A8X8WS06_SALSN|nr:hypothetical protein SASPL_141365 [Salvia splendens]